MAVYANNIVINSGETFSQSLTILNSNSSEIINLTGYAVSSMIRKHVDSSIKTAEFQVGITSASEGLISLSLGSSITSTIKEGRYVYDVLLLSPTNYKSIVVEGSVLIRAGISS